MRMVMQLLTSVWLTACGERAAPAPTPEAAPAEVQAPEAPSPTASAEAPKGVDVQAILARLPTDPALSPEFSDLPRDRIRLGMPRSEFRAEVLPFIPPSRLDSPGNLGQHEETTPAGGCNTLALDWRSDRLVAVDVWIEPEPCRPVVWDDEVVDQ